MVKSLLHKSWPKDVPNELEYRLGEKPLHEYLIQNAMDYPNEPAYHFYGKEITWHQLKEKSMRFAQFLKNKGMGKGNRIALFMQNCPQYLIGHYAIQMIGGIVVPLNPMYKSSELEYFINEANIQVIITGQELYQLVANITHQVSSLQFVVTTHYADFLSTNNTLPLPDELNMKRQEIKDSFDMLSV